MEIMSSFLNLGYGGVEVWWIALSAMVTVFAGALALGIKRGIGWLLRRARVGFLEWFGEAIDSHVAPKFDQIRDELATTAEATQQNSMRAAEAIQAEATRAAADVRREMIDAAAQLKTEQAAMIHDEIGPIVERLESHVTNDDAVMAAAGAALVQGQSELMRQIDSHHKESMDTIHDHIASDEQAFARIEEKLEKP